VRNAGIQSAGIRGHLQLDLIGMHIPGLVAGQDPVPAEDMLCLFDSQSAQIKIRNQTF
jgi:hypothetical protein